MFSINKGTALITGASAGIGAINTDYLAKRGYNLVLVARNGDRLDALAKRITDDTGRSVEVVQADLVQKPTWHEPRRSLGATQASRCWSTTPASGPEATKRVIDARTGSVVAVGHSDGGLVITGAAAGNAKVKSLVYVAAFAPDDGEAIGAFGEKYPNKLGEALRPDTAGFVTIDRAAFRNLFAQDVSVGEAGVMAAAQKPIIGNAFASSVPQAAWKTIPSWYIVAKCDRAINPDLERVYAKRMGVTTVEIDSSHVPFISRPREVARLIVEAARSSAAK